MKKLMTTLLAVLMVFGCAATSVAADEPDTETVDVIYSVEGGYQWSIPESDLDVSAAAASGEVKVTKAMLADGKQLEISINGGENQMTEAGGYGSAAGYNMVSDDDENYFVSYKIEQDSSNSNVGDADVVATLKDGQIAADDVLITVPCGQKVAGAGADPLVLATPVIEALTFTRTGEPALVGDYADTLTFTAEIKDAN